jgi:hypothetical protein
MPGDEAILTPTRVDMPPPFGPWLRQQRDRSGLSQAEIAALLAASGGATRGATSRSTTGGGLPPRPTRPCACRWPSTWP